MTETAWVTERGRRVVVQAAPGSAAARRLGHELALAERVAEAAADLLQPPDGAPLLLTLLDALGVGPGGDSGELRPDGSLARVVDADLPAAGAGALLVRALVDRWFGEQAAAAEPFVTAAAGIAAAAAGTGPSPRDADAWATAELEAGRSVRLPREATDEVDPAATSFGTFLLERNGRDALARLFTEIASAGLDRASAAVLGAPLGTLEEAWLASRRPRRIARGGAFGKLAHQALPLLRPHWKRGLEVFAYVLFGIGFSLALPLSSKYFFDTVIPRSDSQTLAVFIGVLFALYLVGALVGVRRFYVMSLMIQRVSLDLQERMFIHVQRLPHSYYIRARLGDVAARFSHDLNAVQGAIQEVFEAGISQVLLAIATAITLLLLSPLLALVVFATVPLFAAVYFVLRKRLERASVRQQMLYGDMSATIQENLSAYAVVKAFRLESPMLGTYRLRASNLLSALLGVVRVGAMFGTSLGVAVTSGELIVLGLGGYLVIEGTLTLGTLVAFIALTPTLYGTLSGIAGLGQTVELATGSLDRIDELLSEPLMIEDWPGAEAIPPLSSEIAFESVTFGYEPDRPIIHKLDLVIPAGEKVAIVGPSGSGKSTIVNLLMRFWDPQEGSIRFDDRDLRDATIGSVRDQIGLVFQETFVFDTTLRENIAFGRPGASAEEVEEAARGAQLHAFAVSLPDGYDTVLGERGVRMSGGQRQRLAIARIVLRNPAVLILDEATSALDVRTEREVMVALDSLAEGRTTINITHRLASASTCDRIFVLDGGTLVEEGTHDWLLRADGLYRRLWDEQAGAVGLATPLGAVGSGLARIPLLAGLPEGALAALASRLTVERRDAGETVVAERDPGDAFYLVARGEVEVVAADGMGERSLRILGEGDYFGELALLSDAPRSATVRTLVPVELYRLDRDDFVALCEAEPSVLAAIEEEVERRRATQGALVAGGGSAP